MLSLKKSDGKSLHLTPGAILAAEQREEGTAIWYRFGQEVLAAGLSAPINSIREMMVQEGLPNADTMIDLCSASTGRVITIPGNWIIGLNEIERDGKAATQVAVQLFSRAVIYEVQEGSRQICAAIGAVVEAGDCDDAPPLRRAASKTPARKPKG